MATVDANVREQDTKLLAPPAGARSGEICRAGTILERGLLSRWWKCGVGYRLICAKPK